MSNQEKIIDFNLEEVLQSMKQYNLKSLGYPVSKDFDYSELLEFMKYPINNVGDPFEKSTYGVATHDLEKQVVHFFADLFRAPKDNWWGYVTNGGSEGNLYGLYVAREMYPRGMVYYSADTHYSVKKNIHLLGMDSVVIKVQKNGEMDYEDLQNTLNLYRTQAAIIFANLGTTMKEGKDDIKKIKKVLNNTPIPSNYIHVDGALIGSFSALLDDKPNFDFVDGADSIAISGHKFLGSPIPCGVVIVKKNYRNRIAQTIEYIGSLDTTITGSRNGFTPLVLAQRLSKLGKEGLKKRIDACIETAEYCEQELKKMGVNPWRNKNAITVVFDKPAVEICNKWQLATESDYAHIICMPGVSKSDIDEFVSDFKSLKKTK